jgi:hypothetical protein
VKCGYTYALETLTADKIKSFYLSDKKIIETDQIFVNQPLPQEVVN